MIYPIIIEEFDVYQEVLWYNILYDIEVNPVLNISKDVELVLRTPDISSLYSICFHCYSLVDPKSFAWLRLNAKQSYGLVINNAKNFNNAYKVLLSIMICNVLQEAFLFQSCKYVQNTILCCTRSWRLMILM